METTTKLPADFVDQIKNLNLNSKIYDNLIQHLGRTAPAVSIRINPQKPIPIFNMGSHRTVRWLPRTAFYLDERPRFTFMPQLHQGRFYVQDASSMFIATAIQSIAERNNNRPMLCLDACAAPGGKTTAAINALPPGSFIVANEFDHKRAAVLRENIIKWGNTAVAVTKGDTDRFSSFKNLFNIIIVDAPCSGEGMFRKEPEAIAQWSPKLVQSCAALQRQIITNLWPALAPGGYLVYSTCTFNKTENEENLQWIADTFGAESVEIPIDPSWGILRSPLTPMAAYRFLPGEIEGEGLFLAIVRKPGETVANQLGSDKKQKNAKTKPNPVFAQVEKWITPADQFSIFADHTDTIYAVPAQFSNIVKRLAEKTNLIHAGVAIATTKGRDIIPHHSLAMSQALALDAFPCVEFSHEQAIAYLRRDAVELPPLTPRGYILATYQGYPLGFLKNIGNRSNNLYPQPWRILSRQ